MSGGGRFDSNSAGYAGAAVHPPQSLSTIMAHRILPLRNHARKHRGTVPPLKNLSVRGPPSSDELWCWEGPDLGRKGWATCKVGDRIGTVFVGTETGVGGDIAYGFENPPANY